MRPRHYASSDAPGNTSPARPRTGEPNRRTQVTNSRVAADRVAPEDKAASCSIVRETERRSYYRDSKTAAHRARNIRVENRPADTRRSQSRGRRKFARRVKPAERSRK